MRSTVLFLVLILQSFGPQAKDLHPGPDRPQEAPTHRAWDLLLRKHVSPDGWVDYQGFAADRKALEAYLEALGDHPPSENWSREARLAYFINLYNAATVQLILEHYPLGSIRDIPRPWGKKRIILGGQQYSLGEIEHGILRKFGDPRIHFAINCASFSCPKLLQEAYLEATLEAQLEQATRDFLNDPGRNEFTGGQARLSRIFKWYRKDFTAGDTSLIRYINRYLPHPLPDSTPISFLPYDWSLNENKGQ